MAGQFGTDTLIGSSHGAVKVRAQVELAAQTRSAVLILGPPGAGKDHVAKVIHYGQPEPGTLLPLECAIVETNLLRSTLRALDLRHSIAKDLRTTLLLHDVDAAAPEVQADLVEILQLHSGAIRAIATAARPLGILVGERHFLPRLASALSTVVIELVPLVQRLEDLPLLAQVFLEEANLGSAKQVGSFSSEALDQLAAYPWPGNLDELAAIVRRSHEAAQGGEVAARELPNEIHWAAQAAAHPARADEAIVLEEFLARVELELVTRALKLAKGNKTKAARLLGLTRPRLYRRLVQLGLEQPRDREPERSG
jgi:DNA-binding NtrC family response regulator